MSDDDPTLLVIDAIEKISRAMTYKGHWSRKDITRLKHMIAIGMQVTGELDNIEIGPMPADKWTQLTEKE